MQTVRRGYTIALPVLLLTAACMTAGEPQMAIDLRNSRSEIRDVLTQHTPMGSSLNEVLVFIRQHLAGSGRSIPKVTNGPAPASDGAQRRGAKFIRVFLGQYYDHPEVVFFATPLLQQRAVRAVWIFDKHDRLIDVGVEKQTDVY